VIEKTKIEKNSNEKKSDNFGKNQDRQQLWLKRLPANDTVYYPHDGGGTEIEIIRDSKKREK